MEPANNNDYNLYVAASYNKSALEPIIQQLAQVGELDSYTLRQRLIGSDIAQLAKGELQQLRPLADILQHHAIEHWLFQPTNPPFSPALSSAITITPQLLTFHTTSGKIQLEPQHQLMIIAADISGNLAEKQVKRLLVHTTYSGGAPTPMTQQELHREIFKNNPCLDLYWLNDDGEPTSAVRIMPGSFDHRQLGDKAGMSRNGNLANLLEIITTFVTPVAINQQFGLGFLPKCQVQKNIDHNKDQENLIALTHYAWLQLDILAHQPQQPRRTQLPTDSTNNATGIFNTGGISQVVEPIAKAIDPGDILTSKGNKAPISDNNSAGADTTAPQTDPTQLPIPPAVETQSGMSLKSTWWRIAIATIGIGAIFFSDRHSPLPQLIYRHGIATGLIPGLLAGWMLWSALHFWRLKQRIENTPTSKARSAAMGMVEIHGRAQRAYALVAPISQQPCIYYRLKKYQRTRRDSQWRLSQVTSSGNVPFILADDSGTIQVDPSGANIQPTTKHEGFPGQSNVLFAGSSDSDPYEKWVEEVIYSGSGLYIMGFAKVAHPDHNSPSSSASVAEKLRDLKTDRTKLMQYDTDGDGHIDAAEWDQARADMEQQVLHEKLQSGQQRKNQQLIIGAPPHKGLPFIIAETELEEDLTTKYIWYSAALGSGGVGAFIWALIASGKFFHLM